MTILYYPDYSYFYLAHVCTSFVLLSTFVTSQFFFVFPAFPSLSQPSLPTSRIKKWPRHSAQDISRPTAQRQRCHEMPTACRRAKLRCVRCVRWVSESIGEYLTKGCHKCFRPVILHTASFSEGKSSSGIKALLWPMLYFEDFDIRDITQTTFITTRLDTNQK